MQKSARTACILTFGAVLIILPLFSGLAREQAKPDTKAEKQPVSFAEMEKKMAALQKQIQQLLAANKALRKRILSRAQVAAIARQQAKIQINTYLGRSSKDGKRLPVSHSKGGVHMRHVIVGRDLAAGEVLGKEGLRIAVSASGPKFTSSAAVYVYALPVKDLVMQAKYLIHYDAAVPYITGIAQTHFMWKGTFASGKKAPSGKYKIFARIIVKNAKQKVAGSAMRYWGAAYSKQKNKFVVTIK